MNNEKDYNDVDVDAAISVEEVRPVEEQQNEQPATRTKATSQRNKE